MMIGFETGNNNLEQDTGGFSAVFPNTGWSTLHTNGVGSYSFRVNPTDGTGNHGDAITAFPLLPAFTGTAYGRFYAYFGTFPTLKEQFFAYRDESNNGPTWAIQNGSVTLLDGAAGTVYPGTAVISLNTMYRFEWAHNITGHLGTFSVGGVGAVGTTFGTMGTSITQGTDIVQFYIGYTADLNHAGTMDIYYDDIAVNDNTGASQNGSLGEGYISYYTVFGPGDNEQFTSQVGGVAGSQFNYSRANLITTFQGTQYNGDTVTGHIDDFACSNTGNQIAGTAAINVVRVVLDGTTPAAGTNSLIASRIKNVSGGTVSEAVGMDFTGGVGHGTHFSYTRPNGGNWTQADLDKMQIGYRISSGSANETRLTSLFTMVEYTGTAGAIAGVSKNLLGVG